MVKIRGIMSKKVVTLILTVMMLMATGTTAFAYTGDVEEETSTQVEVTVTESDTEAETESETEAEQVIDETPINREDAFSVPGNAQVQDDITNGSSKEFLTIKTKNNNTFYVIIDRSANIDNVYMLSQIDENDLKEFLEEDQNASTIVDVKPDIVIDETPTTQEQPETEEPEKGNSNMGALLGILGLAVAGVGAYGYMKFIKPKKDEDDTDDEGMEIIDEFEANEEDSEDFDFED